VIASLPVVAAAIDTSNGGVLAVLIVPLVVVVVSAVVGPIVVRHFRGPTPYDQLEKRVIALESSHTVDERNFRIVGNGFDALLGLVGRMTDAWGMRDTPPALSENDRQAVQLARNLRTYGQVDDPTEPEHQRS
jgi:hypothetical protein